MFHELLRVWFGWVENWGYTGVFILMVMESSIIPVPSEIVMPPAAFWAAQGKMNLALVILVGTAGGYVGSAMNYWLSVALGAPIFEKYGKYFLMPPKKLKLAHEWVLRFGAMGIFSARLLPVVRHLISIPAGILRMPFGRFSVATLLGAGLWCGILSWFGEQAIGGHPELLESPEAMAAVIRARIFWLLPAVLVLIALYILVNGFKSAAAAKSPAKSA